MKIEESRGWISKEGDETSYIKIFARGAIKVVEIEYESALERLKKSYRESKGKEERRELKERYIERCREENKRYKREIYLEKI